MHMYILMYIVHTLVVATNLTSSLVNYFSLWRYLFSTYKIFKEFFSKGPFIKDVIINQVGGGVRQKMILLNKLI